MENLRSGLLPLGYFMFVFFFLWLCWILPAACGLSLVVSRRGYSLVVVSLVSEHRFKDLLASEAAARRLQSVGFSSCGAWA